MSTLAVRPDTAVAQATTALERWLALVELAPGLAVDGARAAHLRRLVAWFEWVLAEPGCLDAPPLAGLDALVDELTEATTQEAWDSLGRARWAIRVAEDLVRLRRARRHPTVPTTFKVALSSLELSLIGALGNIDG